MFLFGAGFAVGLVTAIVGLIALVVYDSRIDEERMLPP
jgi:hypothetical protein